MRSSVHTRHGARAAHRLAAYEARDSPSRMCYPSVVSDVLLCVVTMCYHVSDVLLLRWHYRPGAERNSSVAAPSSTNASL